MKQLMPEDWQHILHNEWDASYLQQLEMFLKNEYKTKKIYPLQEQLFTAFKKTPYKQVRVVLLGQDPYHGEGQAHGMSFSVQQGVSFPPSLRNMLKELKEDIGCETPKSGDLTKWASQGVLLLNTVLTVEEGKAGSHQRKGWETFTDAVIHALLEREEPVIFVLWGKQAQAKEKFIQPYKQHRILKAPHPSPLSAHRGFFGSKPYSTINELLQKYGHEPIDWCLI